MSRPRKMHKPLKASFSEAINAVADGGGIRATARDKRLREITARAAQEPPVPKKP